MRTLKTRNVTIDGRRTSIRLEPEMWDALHEICQRESLTHHDLCTRVARDKSVNSLTASVRVYVMNYFRDAATEDGHRRASHGVMPRLIAAS